MWDIKQEMSYILNPGMDGLPFKQCGLICKDGDVRRRLYQYNDINPFAQKKLIIKSLAGDFRLRPSSVNGDKMHIFTFPIVR